MKLADEFGIGIVITNQVQRNKFDRFDELLARQIHCWLTARKINNSAGGSISGWYGVYVFRPKETYWWQHYGACLHNQVSQLPIIIQLRIEFIELRVEFIPS